MGRRGPTLRMNYRGWPTDEKKKPKTVDSIDADIDPQQFWAQCVSQRKPVSTVSPHHRPSPATLTALSPFAGSA
jgi:hypothetical protein